MSDMMEKELGRDQHRGRLPLAERIARMKIQSKISILVGIICLFSLLSVSLTAALTVKNVTEYSRAISAALGADAARGSGDALLEQAHRFLQAIAEAQARSCNQALDTIKFNVALLEELVQNLFYSGESYGGSSPAAQSAASPYESLYRLPAGASLTPEQHGELELLRGLDLLTPVLAANPQIKQLYVGMESGLFYAYTNTPAENPGYDCRTRPWYQKAVAHPDDVIFTDVYEDAFGMGMMMTAAKAVYDEDGALLGVAALDILLTDLKQLIENTHSTKSGYTFILDSDGAYVVHPGMGTEDFDPLRPQVAVESGGALAEGYRQMMQGETGFIQGIINGQSAYMAFGPISVADWSMGIVVFEEELLSSLEALSGEMDALTAQSERDILSMSARATSVFASLFVIVIVMVAALAIRLSRYISTPIQNLTKGALKIGEGNFEYRIPVKTHDEIGFLTEAFNTMADNLHRYTQSIITLNDTKVRLEVAANTDTLTGILNRRHFLELAGAENDAARKANLSAYIIIFDLDRFKRINDTYGHSAGDQTLREITEIVGRSIRSDDLFARYGGEEFILFIADVSRRTVCDLIERIRQNIHRHRIAYQGAEISISASFGIAPASPVSDVESAILCADKSLYRAKNEGRNKVVFYGQER